MTPHPRTIRVFCRSGALLAAVLMALGGAPAGAEAQDPCPSASAVDAEAGWTAYSAGSMGEARSFFEAALERCDNDHYARTGLGYVALRQGDTEGGARLFRIVVRAEPGNVDALVGMGLVSWRTGDLDAVRRYFEEVLQYAPEHPTALDFLDRLAGASARAQDEAGRAWDAGEMERARTLYSQRLSEDPDDGVALLRRGLMHGWDAEYDQALELLDHLVELATGNLDARLARARVVAWSGQVGAAITAVAEVLEMEPGNIDALATLAQLYSWAGRGDDAVESYGELLSIAPEHSTARRQRAQALAWSQQYEQSIDAYVTLVEQRPDDVAARVGLARARAFSGDFDGAIEEYRRVLELAPGNVTALAGQARTLGWAGRLVDAEHAARAAVDEDVESGVAWSALGEVYRWQGRDGAAIEALRRAGELAPNDATIRDQVRSVELALAPRVRPWVRAEDDSDGNRMLTTSLIGRFHPAPRLEVRAQAYRKALEQALSLGRLERSAMGASVSAFYEVDPGWIVSAGLGGNRTDGFGDPTLVAYRGSLRSPQRYPVDVTLEFASTGLDDTAAMAERAVRSTGLLLTTAWRPTLDWRVDGQLGLGRYDATESNGRRSFLVTATRTVGSTLFVGGGFRGFSFEKDLFDGYFDPDFYGVFEVSGTWLQRPLPWSFLVEVAPGVEQVTTDGDPRLTVRSNGRAAYRVNGVSEVSLALSYSTASVTTFAGGGGYDYVSLVLGVSWIFK